MSSLKHFSRDVRKAQEAVELIKQASLAGHAQASYELAGRVSSQLNPIGGRPQDPQSRNKSCINYAVYLERAARQGHPKAAAELIQFSQNLLHGVTEGSDAAKASTAGHCFALAAAHLNTEELYATGKIYWEGTGTTRWDDEANPIIATYYFHASAAGSGLSDILQKLKTDFPDGKPQFLLGQAYWLSGDVIKPCSETEFATSAKKVMDNAILCFNAAAELKYQKGTASHMLSTIYKGANKLHLNHRQITDSSKKQHVFNVRDSVQNADKKVISYLEQAHAQGHGTAAFELGKIDEKKSTNFFGMIREKSPEFKSALAWYDQVAVGTEHYVEAQKIIAEYTVSSPKLLKLSDDIQKAPLNKVGMEDDDL